ncbi:MAG: hypothetical protein Q7Q71_10965 [Verrucomicrobiota bacterium JB023]|nr:hypothetical protein [Verrucomicrobiota bacterium JB023]
MPQTPQTKLDTGDPFPKMDLKLTTGESLQLPKGNWTFFLLYRGNW